MYSIINCTLIFNKLFLFDLPVVQVCNIVLVLDLVIIELKDHRLIQIGRDLWKHLSNLPLKAGLIRSVCSGTYPIESWTPPRMENPQSLWAPVPAFDHSSVKRFSLYLTEISHVPTCGCWPSFYCCAPLRRVGLHLLLTL